MKDESELKESAVTIKPTQLSLRLMEIVSAVPPCERVLDIGSDHGHVPSWLLENHIAKRAVATDIHADPAETTRRYLRRQGVMQNAEVFHTDGLHGIRMQKGDVVILSGLGGLEMIRIISESLADHAGAFPRGTLFVLQPQRSVEDLRSYLSGNGFSIEGERICIDREKFYVILLTAWTGQPAYELSLTELALGPYLLKNRPGNFGKYLHHQRNVLKKHMRARPELESVLSDIDSILLEPSDSREVQLNNNEEQRSDSEIKFNTSEVQL